MLKKPFNTSKFDLEEDDDTPAQFPPFEATGVNSDKLAVVPEEEEEETKDNYIYGAELTKKQIEEFFDTIESSLELAKKSAYPLKDIGGMESTISQAVLAKLLTKLNDLDRNEFTQRLMSMQPGSEDSIIFNRTINPLTNEKNLDEFKMTVVRNLDGTYLLAIALKQKRIDFTKRKMILDSGSSKVLKIDLVIGKTGKSAVYAELTASALPLAKINSIFETYKADFKNKNPGKGEIEANKHAQATLNQHLQKEHAKNLAEIKFQQRFNDQPGFAPLICAQVTETPVACGTSGIIIRVPQIILLAPYKHTLFNFATEQWRPSGYTDHENQTNMPIHIAKIFAQMVDLIETMHKQQVEHRDMKLLNFLLDYNKSTGALNVEITDFGKAKKFGQAESVEGTPMYLSPMQLQMFFSLKGESIAKIERMAEDGFDPLVSQMVDSYGWIVLKEQLLAQGKGVNDKILAPAAQVIDGSNDIWQFACVYFELKYGRSCDGSEDSYQQVQDDAFLKNLFHSGKKITATELKQLYLDSEYYKENANQPILAPQPVAAITSSSPWIENPIQQIDSFINTRNQAEKTQAITQLMDLIPTARGINLNLLITTNTTRLNRLVNNLKEFCEEIEEKRKAARKAGPIDEAKWATEIGQSELAANIALGIACRLLSRPQTPAASPAAKNERRSSFLFSSCCIAPAAPAEAAPALNSDDYKQLIERSEARIKELAPAVRESLSEQNFPRRYSKLE